MISNIKKNIMGTASFDGKFAGMRKAQDFIVYPMQDSGEIISVQSDNRFGRIDLGTGKVEMSAPATCHAGSAWLLLCQMRKTTKTDTIPAEELQALRAGIKATGGLLVGNSIVKCENIGALAL